MIPIRPPTQPFPDPKFCNDQVKECGELFRGQCDHFFVNLKHDFPEKGKSLYQKCDECKELYCEEPKNGPEDVYCRACSEAGGADKPIYHLPPFCTGTIDSVSKLAPCPIPFCREPRGKEDDGSYICPCPHCGDTVPF